MYESAANTMKQSTIQRSVYQPELLTS